MSKCFRTPNFLDFMMIKGSLVRKPPRYGRLSCLAFAASWQPHHHLNHSVHDITMSTTSSPSSCQVVGKCKFHFDSLLSNPPRIPISKLVPIAISYFRNVRPGACRALPGMVYQWSQWRRHLQLEFLLPKMCWMMLNPLNRTAIMLRSWTVGSMPQSVFKWIPNIVKNPWTLTLNPTKLLWNMAFLFELWAFSGLNTWAVLQSAYVINRQTKPIINLPTFGV